MLAFIFVVSCFSVCGFYVYVLVQLRREQKREDAHKKHLPEHFYEMEPDPRRGDAKKLELSKFRSSETLIPPDSKAEAISRQEAMLRMGLTVGGLAALFGAIEFFNSLVTRLHWY
jgi:hypothetical protein